MFFFAVSATSKRRKRQGRKCSITLLRIQTPQSSKLTSGFDLAINKIGPYTLKALLSLLCLESVPRKASICREENTDKRQPQTMPRWVSAPPSPHLSLSASAPQRHTHYRLTHTHHHLCLLSGAQDFSPCMQRCQRKPIASHLNSTLQCDHEGLALSSSGPSHVITRVT